MKKLRKFLYGLGIILLLITGSGWMVLEYFVPQRTGELNSDKIQHPAEISYDKWGIPHIYAKNEQDAYFSLGYVHAQDRLFQMEMLRRVAKGELAEIFGVKALESDKFFRTMRIRSISKSISENYKKNLPEYKALKAYVEGINEYINLGKTPIEYKLLNIPKTSFSAEDVFAITGYMAFSFLQCFKLNSYLEFVADKFSNKHFEELQAAATGEKISLTATLKNQVKTAAVFPNLHNLPDELIDIVGIQPLVGSNGWVISGSHTKSKKPILANDPHVMFSSPNIWYEAHISTPEFDFYGHHIAGVPTALLGHNKKFAWGITMLHNQDVFFYKERLNSNDNRLVKSKNGWEEIRIENHQIKIKDQDSLDFKVKFTNRGPIINQVVKGFKTNKQPISMQWNFSSSENDLLKAFYGLAHTSSVKKVSPLLKNISSPGLNIFCADIDNNIGWWTVGSLYPKQLQQENSLFHNVYASNKKHLSFEKHPHTVNPSSGFIVSANNDPFVVDNKFTKVLGNYSIPQRYNRIHELIKKKKGSLDTKDIKNIQLDDKTKVHKSFLNKLLSLLATCKNIQENHLSYEVLSSIRNWDGYHKLEDYRPSVFYVFISNLLRELFYKDSIDINSYKKFVASHEIYQIISNLIDNKDSIWWQNNNKLIDQKQLVSKVWLNTIDSLCKKWGNNPNKWTWGKFHQVEYKHVLGKQYPLNLLFNVGPYPAEGSNEVINNQEFYLLGESFPVVAGPSTRSIIDLGSPEISYGISPTGQSGYFYDKHYKDQTSLYNKGKYRYQLMNKAEIKKNQKSILFIKPVPVS